MKKTEGKIRAWNNMKPHIQVSNHRRISLDGDIIEKEVPSGDMYMVKDGARQKVRTQTRPLFKIKKEEDVRRIYLYHYQEDDYYPFTDKTFTTAKDAKKYVDDHYDVWLSEGEIPYKKDTSEKVEDVPRMRDIVTSKGINFMKLKQHLAHVFWSDKRRKVINELEGLSDISNNDIEDVIDSFVKEDVNDFCDKGYDVFADILADAVDEKKEKMIEDVRESLN